MADPRQMELGLGSDLPIKNRPKQDVVENNLDMTAHGQFTRAL